MSHRRELQSTTFVTLAGLVSLAAACAAIKPNDVPASASGDAGDAGEPDGTGDGASGDSADADANVDAGVDAGSPEDGLPPRKHTVSAAYGHAHMADQTECFEVTLGGGVKNTCDAQRTYLVPLFTDSSGWYAPTFAVKGVGRSGDVLCTAFGVSWDRESNWTSYQVPNMMGDVPEKLTPGWVPIAGTNGWGTLYGACWLQKGAELYGVTW